jgi:quinolinate synthase
MAEQIEPELLAQLKAKDPERIVVAYINTTAKLKELSDVCVTSATAVKIVKSLPESKILFIPDCNLGGFVKKQVPEKDIKLIQGGCPVHASVTVKEALNAKEQHPEALLLVHPECDGKIAEMADYVGSTSGIMEFAVKSGKKEFIIGTEISIVEHLQFECPDKRFFALSKKITCPNMKLTTLVEIYNVLQDLDNAFEILMTDEEISKSRKCIDRMIALGG